MSNLFISHSSKNDYVAIALQSWLIEQGWDEIFLDLDPQKGIVAGEQWRFALKEAVKRCDAMLLCITTDWLNSKECYEEFTEALALNKLIIGILVEDIDINKLPLEMTTTWQVVDLVNGKNFKGFTVTHPINGNIETVSFAKSGLIRLKTGLVKSGLNPLYFEWPPKNDPQRSPYRGMLPLEAEDAGIFFGREAPINEFLAKIRELRTSSNHKLMVILGASGAGKSSFLRAGVLPRIMRDERKFLVLPIIRPEQSVLWGEKGFYNALVTIFKKYKLDIDKTGIKESILSSKQDNASEIIKLLNQLVSDAQLPNMPGELIQEPPTLVLTIDQGEELFHSEGAEESQLFLDLLHHLTIHQNLPLITIFTIRSDSYESLQTSKALEGITQQTFSLSPVPKGAYHNIIEGPADRLKDTDRPLEMDPILTQRLLEDLEKGGNKDALPLLAFTLERLYLGYGLDGDLRIDEYEDMGGFDGAIEAAVEQAIVNAEKDPTLPNDRNEIISTLRTGMIPWLAGIDPDTQKARRRVAKYSEIPKEALPIMKHLIDQRLLATDINTNNEKTLEPAHEALLRQWKLLESWLIEDASVLTVLESVQRASKDWHANAHSQSWLAHSKGRLEDAEQLLQRDDLSHFLSKEDWDYLNKCRIQENKQKDKALTEAKKLAKSQEKQALLQKQEEVAQKKATRRTLIGGITGLVLSTIVGLLVINQNKKEKIKNTNQLINNWKSYNQTEELDYPIDSLKNSSSKLILEILKENNEAKIKEANTKLDEFTKLRIKKAFLGKYFLEYNNVKEAILNANLSKEALQKLFKYDSVIWHWSDIQLKRMAQLLNALISINKEGKYLFPSMKLSSDMKNKVKEFKDRVDFITNPTFDSFDKVLKYSTTLSTDNSKKNDIISKILDYKNVYYRLMYIKESELSNRNRREYFDQFIKRVGKLSNFLYFDKNQNSNKYNDNQKEQIDEMYTEGIYQLDHNKEFDSNIENSQIELPVDIIDRAVEMRWKSDFKAAENEYSKILKYNNKDYKVLKGLAEVKIMQENYPSAKNDINNLMNIYPENKDFLSSYIIFIDYIHGNKVPTPSLSKYQENTILWLFDSIAKNKRNNKDYKGAVKIYNMEEHFPFKQKTIEDLQINKSWNYIEAGLFDQAWKPAKFAYEHFPNSLPAKINFGHLNLFKGNKKRAYEIYQACLPLIKSNKSFEETAIADFDLFIDNGWHVQDSVDAKKWFIENLNFDKEK